MAFASWKALSIPTVYLTKQERLRISQSSRTGCAAPATCPAFSPFPFHASIFIEVSIPYIAHALPRNLPRGPPSPLWQQLFCPSGQSLIQRWTWDPSGQMSLDLRNMCLECTSHHRHEWRSQASWLPSVRAWEKAVP